MFRKVTPERAFLFTSTIARVSACLLPPANAKKFQIVLYELYWWFCLCLSLSLSLPVIYDLYLNSNDVDCILLNIAELCPMCTGTLKIILCNIYAKEIQACISEAECLLKSATIRERQMFQRYVDRCLGLYSFMLFCIVMTVVGFSSSHMYLPQPYPSHSSYPFEVNTNLLKNSLRGLQIVAIIQTGLLVALDLQFSSLIWLTAARFEILSNEVQQASDTVKFRTCIRKHQEILQFAAKINLVTRLIAYGLGLSTAIGTVCGSIQFLRDTYLMIKIRFVSFVLAGGMQLLVYCWPAEYLFETSTAVGFAVYCSKWIGQPPELKSLVIIMMQRVKTPSVISIGATAPILSLNFYGSFLSTSFSYFTTLRATTTTSASD